MITKKEAVTLGVLAIGGLAAASIVAGKEEDALPRGVSRGFFGLPPQEPFTPIPTITEIPGETFTGFPEPVDYSDFFQSFFGASQPSVSSTSKPITKKEQVIFGGYMPSGKTYVFGGKAFETQAAKEVVSEGYSPTLATAFGISPLIAVGDASVVKKRRSSGSSYKSSRNVRRRGRMSSSSSYKSSRNVRRRARMSKKKASNSGGGGF